MEDIKTNFDKIMAQFSDASKYGIPKKLSFDCADESLEDNAAKKRRISFQEVTNGKQADDTATPVKNTSTNSTLNSSFTTGSPWEMRRMKADLIEANARISKLKQEVEHQHKIRQEMETMYESKVRELTKQCSYSSDKILELEKHMSAIRKREQRLKSDLMDARNEVSEQKTSYEETIYKLEKAKSNIEENARVMQNSLTNEISELQRNKTKLEMELDLITEEFGTTRSTLLEYKEKASAYDELKLSLEKEKQISDESKSRVKQLEFEISSYGDWKEITKKTQSRLASIPDMDKEIERLRASNKNLFDLLGHKLLLEEQVYDMKTRLEVYENAKNDAVSLQVKLTSQEQELKEWVKVAQDHCLPNTLVSPIALRSRIEEILQNDIIMKSEKGSEQLEKNSVEAKVQDLQLQLDTYIKNNGSLRTALKQYKNVVLRVQKKLMLVARERDCYKQLLENFEKDLTVSNAIELATPDSQIRSRIEMLEKTLAAYKDMCATLEKELESIKLLPDLPMDGTGLQMESYEPLKQEIETLRMENEKLKRRKEELELEMEHRSLKGDFNINKYKVVHFTKNPAAEAYENASNRFEKLQAEIERLKRRNQKLEQDQEEMTTRLNDTANMTMNVKEINTLRSELESMNNKMKKMKEIYKSASFEFREVCYMLFGYRVDRINGNNYKICNMYAEAPDEYLSFRLNDLRILDMMETPYSITLKDMIQNRLSTHKSLPVFLSTLTLELFNKTTVQN